MRKQIRITEQQLAALGNLADELGIRGQRETWFQAMILWLADTADAAMPETVCALKIASDCAIGHDWHEMVDTIEPDYLA